ncbi:unnamed protein product, partial [Polarella glacialis]
MSSLRIQRTTTPLYEEVPVFTEFSALRACARPFGPWHHGMRSPRIARLEARQPPPKPPAWLQVKSGGYLHAAQELARKSNLGTADVRIWVSTSQEEVQEPSENEGPQGPQEGSGQPVRRNSALREKRQLEHNKVKAFLGHKRVLMEISLKLRRLLEASEAQERKPDSIHEIELRLRSGPDAFAEVLAFAYGATLQISDAHIQLWAMQGWWPLLDV